MNQTLNNMMSSKSAVPVGVGARLVERLKVHTGDLIRRIPPDQGGLFSALD